MSASNNLLLADALLPTYPTPHAGFVEGDGMWLTGSDGRRYLDFAAGIAVVSLGHRHPAPLAAAHAQLDRLWHASNLFATEPDVELAQILSDRFGGAHAFFCNSGTEANEAALKYARKATGKAGVIALEGSFHGRTLGALAVTGQPSKRAAFEPLGPARFAQPNDVASLHAAAGDDVGLLLLDEDRDQGADPVDHAPEVHSQDPLPVSLGGLPDRALGGDAGVVADDVGGAELVEDPVAKVFHRVGTGNVGLDGQHLSASRAQLSLSLFEGVCLDVREDDLHPLPSEALGHRKADAAGPARHHRHAVTEVLHLPPAQ